jgi:hypothetical protein
MLAAALLMCEGVSAAEAWVTIRGARGLDVPDTPEPRAWVETVMAAGQLLTPELKARR